VLHFLGQNIANGFGLPSDLASKSSQDAALAGAVPMPARQLLIHDGGKGLLWSLVFRNSLPQTKRAAAAKIC
jgi:hypothetical protein